MNQYETVIQYIFFNVSNLTIKSQIEAQKEQKYKTISMPLVQHVVQADNRKQHAALASLPAFHSADHLRRKNIHVEQNLSSLFDNRALNKISQSSTLLTQSHETIFCS